MAKRQYTNVYTILDKARKGELELQEQPSSLFRSIVPYKRPDIIKPEVHYLDERVINRFVINHLLNTKNIQSLQNYFSNIGIMKATGEIYQDMNELIHKFPKGLKNDFFNLFNKDFSQLEFSDRGDDNKMRYKFIEKANQPVHKIMTVGSNAKSLIFTQHVMEYFTRAMLTQKYKKPEDFEQMQQQMQQEVQQCMNPQPGQGQGQPQPQQQQPQDQGPQDQQPQDQQQDQGDQDPQDQQNPGQGQPNDNSQQDPSDDQQDSQSEQTGGNSSSKGTPQPEQQLTDKQLEKMLNDMLNKKSNELDELMNKAQAACQKIDEAYNDDEQNNLWESAQDGDLSAESFSIDKIEELATQLKSIRMAMGGVKQFIKKIVDNSVSYFSSKEETTHESLMESGHVDQVQDIYMLHPKLRKFMMDDIMVKETKRVGKINLYIDNSGSMDAHCGARDADGNYITRLTFAKGFALKMLEMDLLNEVYTFNDNVVKRKATLVDITKLKVQGGTNTNLVVNHIANQGVNAIVITDGTDSCYGYSEKAYFIGTEGASFNGFNRIEEFHKQMCVFDGKSVKQIDKKGYVKY